MLASPGLIENYGPVLLPVGLYGFGVYISVRNLLMEVDRVPIRNYVFHRFFGSISAFVEMVVLSFN